MNNDVEESEIEDEVDVETEEDIYLSMSTGIYSYS